MYDQNYYFSLGLIPKPKMAYTFWPKPHFKRRNLATDSMGYYFHHEMDSKIKFAAKYEMFVDYYCRGGQTVSSLLPITKLDLGFSS